MPGDRQEPLLDVFRVQSTPVPIEAFPSESLSKRLFRVSVSLSRKYTPDECAGGAGENSDEQ